MKKLILFSAVGLIGFSAEAQQAVPNIVQQTDAVANQNIADYTKVSAPLGSARYITAARVSGGAIHSNAKSTAAPFFTETFGSGTRTSLPTGWTATTGAGLLATWHWTNTRSGGGTSGNFSLTPINSTTASDGWMIYDSDSIGDLTKTVLPITGSLISPKINCSSHPTVLVQFQNYFRKFRDSTYLDVSNDNGTTWTEYPIAINNNMNNNTTNATNPVIVRINVTPTAGGQANVKLRFRYVLNYQTGVYGSLNWLIDDVAVSEQDAVEAGISNPAMLQYNGGNNEYNNFSLYSNCPISLVDSMLPVIAVANNGINTINNLTARAQVFFNGNTVYDQSETYPTLAPNTNASYTDVDSLIEFTDVPNFKPTAIGSYTAAFSINPTGDAFTLNNVDTQRFNVTDTVYTTYGKTVAGGYYLHRNAAAGELSYQWGMRFDIPAKHRDTITSVDVAFENGTTPGVNTVVQIYKIVGKRSSSAGLSWSPVATMRTKVLAAGDISTSAAIVYTNYPANTSTGLTQFILDSGTYVAVVKTLNAPASSDVTISVATPIVDNILGGYFGQADTSNNAPGFSFSPSGIRTGSEQVPLMHVIFGHNLKNSISVASINGVTIGDAYPNPANNTLTIPVSLTTSAAVNVNLTNTVGQVMQTQNLGSMTAGASKKAVFNTSSLSSGIYFYTVEANGERVTKRVVVAH